MHTHQLQVGPCMYTGQSIIIEISIHLHSKLSVVVYHGSKSEVIVPLEV